MDNISFEGIITKSTGGLYTVEKEDGTFDHNSYSSGDAINSLKWSTLEEAIGTDIFSVFSYEFLDVDIDEEKDKFLVSMQKQYIDHPVPVKAMVYLYTHDGKSMECKKLEGMDKFGCIASNQFLQNLLGKDIFLPYIGQECLRIASKVDVYLIGRPLQGEAGEEIADFISGL